LNEEEKKFINEHKGKIPQAVIAKRLGRGYSTINKFCNGKVYEKKKGFFDFDSFVF
jgi:IS30 family transposase